MAPNRYLPIAATVVTVDGLRKPVDNTTDGQGMRCVQGGRHGWLCHTFQHRHSSQCVIAAHSLPGVCSFFVAPTQIAGYTVDPAKYDVVRVSSPAGALAFVPKVDNPGPIQLL